MIKKQRPIRVALVDDHVLVRRGFRRILEDDTGIQVVGEAGNGLEAIALARSVRPDVFVMDMAMPEMSGTHAAMEILKTQPDIKILILSMYSDDQYVKNALDAGAKGYILKNAIETDLTRAVHAVASGQSYLSPGLSDLLVRALQSGSLQEAAQDPYDKLTQREKQVLQMIAHGKSNKEIATILNLSVNTVSVHRANLMETLQLHRTAELVLLAVKKGLVVPE
ncbi:MAG: response regulator [Acidobacteriota bacterium]